MPDQIKIQPIKIPPKAALITINNSLLGFLVFTPCNFLNSP